LTTFFGGFAVFRFFAAGSDRAHLEQRLGVLVLELDLVALS
jgi:hypothetical protein